MKKIKKLFGFLGPGFITGASDDDPSGIATYSQTGALFGFQQAWTALFSFPLMTVVQEMCGRIGLVTGMGLAGVIKQHYPKKVLYITVLLLFIANTVNIGADLGAMAVAAQLIWGLPFLFWLIAIVVVTLILEIFVSYKVYARYLKYLALALLAYVFTAVTVKIDWSQVLFATFVPRISLTPEYIQNIVAILGTTISPYLFFWQANEEVEEQVAHNRLRQMGAGQARVTPNDISRLRIDTTIGMLFSNLVMFFIIVTTGATLFPNGISAIDSATDAALALRPFAGDFAFLIFALGILGTGLLAVPILAGSASYAVSEVFGWRAGLHMKLQRAHGFYAVIAIATIAGILLNLTGLNPLTALYYSAILNGIIAPPLLVMILFISNNKKIMGGKINGWVSNVIGVVTIAIMSVAAIVLLWQLVS